MLGIQRCRSLQVLRIRSVLGIQRRRGRCCADSVPWRLSAPVRQPRRTVGLVFVSPEDGPTELLPLFPLGTVLVPSMRLSLHVFEPRYRELVADLLAGQQTGGAPEFGVIALRRGREVGDLAELYEVGTSALISDVVPLPDGRCNLAAVGRRRFSIRSLDTASRPYLQGEVTYLPEAEGTVRPGMQAAVRDGMLQHAALLSQLGIAVDDHEELFNDPVAIGFAAAQQPGLALADRQAILEAADTGSRLSVARKILRREYELLRTLHAVPVTAAAFAANPPGGS